VNNTRYRWFTVLLACGLLTACGASTATTDSASKAAPDSTQSPGRVINLFGNGKTPPPLLRHLATVQAAHLPALRFSYGPTYQHGRVIGVVVTYDPLCQRVAGASVTETASTVMVTVLGSRARRACPLPLEGTAWAVKLPHPLGHRMELHRP
jgi:hypothetical protein